MFDAGLADKVEIRLQDYRDERGRYDRIASIEMLEAVGEQFWPAYFAQLRDRLQPGGAAGIQTITIQERFFDNYKREIDFIRRYVFPGGMLPTPSTLKSLGERFGVPFTRRADFRRRLCPHAVGMARAIPRRLAADHPARLRRAVPAAVGILPRLLRGRIPAPAISTCGRWFLPAGSSSGEDTSPRAQPVCWPGVIAPCAWRDSASRLPLVASGPPDRFGATQ